LLRAQLPVSPRLSWPWHAATQSRHLHKPVMAFSVRWALPYEDIYEGLLALTVCSNPS
jgi:hypothetical protein